MEHSTEEEWRPVIGYEGHYEVSDRGRLRSLPRAIKRSDGRLVRVGLRFLKIGIDAYGYPQASLHLDGVRKLRKIHHLVLESFVAPRPHGMEARHIDGVKTNNIPSNLAWGTRSQNIHDNVSHGVHNNARKTHCRHGHEFIPANIVIANRGRTRLCRACQMARGRAKYYGTPFDPALADERYGRILAGEYQPVSPTH